MKPQKAVPRTLRSNWLLCLKHGDKYSSEYVNKLYSMVKRNSTVPFQFACITEDPSDLDPNILIIPTPNYPLQGWWFKTWVLSNELPITGNILFMDLDLVIINNIDNIWDYHPNNFVVIRDFFRHINPACTKYNSSVFKFQSHQYSYIWEQFNIEHVKRFHGDQDWFYYYVDNAVYFPDEWIQSYKWEVRDRSELQNGLFTSIRNPVINPNTSILVFHGNPNPHEVQDPVVIQNWK